MSLLKVLASAPDTVMRLTTEDACREALIELGLAPEAFLAGTPPPGLLRIHTFEHVETHWVAIAHVCDPKAPLWVLLAWPKNQVAREAFLAQTLRRDTWWTKGKTGHSG